MNIFRVSSIIALCFLMVACGGSTDSKNQARCDSNPADVNWDLLLTDQAQTLSEYQLFEKDCDPTSNPNSGGLPYDLTTELFTDYSSKYRFAFIPPGKSATYSEDEVLDYPVGTVLVKTFSVPKDTSIRGYQAETKFEDEELIETRLLIHRTGGWLALPYVWSEDKTDASLHISGKAIDVSIVHNGEQKDFTYSVPDIQTCKQCHQLTNTEGIGEDQVSISRIVPIGPKSRFLNRDIEYAEGSQNQLAYMVENNLLTGAPVDLTSINTVPYFSDGTDIKSKTSAELEALAKGYLDINCAHCHRRTGDNENDGKAGYSGLKLEFWRDFITNVNEHGVCKIPIAFSVQGLAFDVVPGSAEDSVLPYRMALESAKKMPEVGRDLTHNEGIDLVKAWINSMPVNNCGQ